MTTPDLMLPKDMQLSNEHKYSRKHIDGYIDSAIRENPTIEAKVSEGVELLNDWLALTYYKSKQARLDQIKHMDMEAIVRQVFVATTYCQAPEPFTSIAGQLAARLHFDDRIDAIKTTSEIVAVLCNTDAFNIMKTHELADLSIESCIPVSEELLTYITNSRYLPPMVCEPETLTRNKQSAYLTHNDTLLLGKNNHHDHDISLDVLNTQNHVPLCLNTAFLSTVEEEATFDLSDPEKRDIWNNYKQQGYELYSLMVKQGNRFYLTNKPDKRGRIYTQGYHITLQGTAFKKACVDLADQEIVEGVPSQ